MPLSPRSGLMFLDFFAGAGGLSAAMRRKGIMTEESEACKNGLYVRMHDLNLPTVIESYERLILSGAVLYCHFGLPCSTWSTMALMSGGTWRSHQPLGGSNEKTAGKG